jgi:LuxR family glucitol operon transcriptional activator
VAHECLQTSQDSDKPADTATFAGFVWASAKDQDLTLDDLLDAVARTSRYVGIIQKLQDQKRVAVCDLLRAKPHLLIVDNYETITDDDVRDFLIKLPEPSKALITSRGRDWSDAEVISLKDLSQAESFELMRTLGQRLRLSAVQRASDQELLPLHRVSGRSARSSREDNRWTRCF